MRILCYLSIAILLSGFSLQGQNQLDAAGKKTGPWQGFYEDGTLRYEGTFLDGKPVGTMNRYTPEGNLAVNMFFFKGTDRCRATLLRPDGTKRAEGVYESQAKDSTWTYFGSDETIRLSEQYKNGELHGTSVSYYPSGSISGRTAFYNGLKEGEQIKFFENGDTMLISGYSANKMHGDYKTYYPEGILQITGRYVNDLKDGDWTYRDEEGNIETVIRYDHGNVLNPEDLEKNFENFIQRLEENAGNIPDPADVQH